jgi:hypothetical protein
MELYLHSFMAWWSAKAQGQLYIYLYITYLTDSTEQSPYWEADSPSASQETPAFNAGKKFITVLTRDRHFSLSWARWTQSKTWHPIL